VLIDRFVPRFDVVERHRTGVGAPPERVWAALQELDLGRSRAVRWLFAARSLGRPGRGRSFRLADAGHLGFVVLGEERGEEVVLGLVGRFWTVRGGVVRIEPDEFTTFDRPGFAKAGWSFRLTPRDGGGTDVLTETRVVTTDEAARRKFRRYWRVIRPFSGAIRRRALVLLKEAAERS
jgi:hypothetical protein